jgi:hypothetical protein
MRPARGFVPSVSVVLMGMAMVMSSASAQSPSHGTAEPINQLQAPPAPAQQEPTSATGLPAVPEEGKQTSRILYIFPNFRSVSVNEKLPPQSPKEKLWQTTQDSFDYSSFIFVGALAGISQAENSVPEFHQGAAGYGRYYWHTLADQTDENYWVEFLFPVTLHQDSRYYTLGRGSLLKRASYAVTRIAITRKDDGGETFNFSEVIGAGASAGISNLYYPSPERTWTKTGQRWALNVGLDGATFLIREFWPDINSAIFHQKD